MSSFATIAALEFGSPAMLAWLAAAALPWLINLWIRRRHAETPWAAVQLLAAAVEARARRMRLREWLLLAMRAAVVALVAAAASRPAWRTGAAASDERTHHVVVVDCSLSMDCREGELSRLQRAKRRAIEIVEAAPAGDAVTVIQWSASAENLLGRAVFDPREAASAIDAMRQTSARADLEDALLEAQSAIDSLRGEASIQRVRVWFLSDATAATWAAATDGDSAQSWRRLAERAAITIESVDDGGEDNLAVTALQLATPLATVGAPLRVTARLEAYGQRTWSDALVELRVAGAPVDQRRIAVAPGEPAEVAFQTQLDAAGSVALEARFEATDALRTDNRRWLVARARRHVRAACFEGAPRAADDMARALNPRREEADGTGGIQVEVEQDSQIGRTDLATYDAVFLCNVGALTPRAIRQLQRFVAGGGAMVAVLGDRTEAASFNKLLALLTSQNSDEASRAATVRLAGEPVAGAWRIDPREYRHPVLAPLAGPNRAGLSGVRVEKYFPLDVAPGAAAQEAFGFASGDPALVVGDYERGRFALLATNVALAGDGVPWSNFAVSPDFLPLVRELLSFLVRGADRGSSLAVGEQLDRPGSVSRAGSADGAWVTPAGRRTSTTPATDSPGVYSFRPEHGETSLIAVNVDPRESDLTTIDLASLPSGDGSVAGQSTGASAQGRSRSLAAALLAAALGLALLETTTAWMLGRGRA